MLKQIIIPVAAFAVTVTGASAFNPDMLDKLDLDLSNDQIEAFEEAHELRLDDKYQEAREVLEDADIDRATLKRVHTAVFEHRGERHEAMKEAVENEDYDAFLELIDGTPLADVIDSESDFEKFIAMHEAMQEGDRETAKEIREDLGIERGEKGEGKRFSKRAKWMKRAQNANPERFDNFMKMHQQNQE